MSLSPSWHTPPHANTIVIVIEMIPRFGFLAFAHWQLQWLLGKLNPDGVWPGTGEGSNAMHEGGTDGKGWTRIRRGKTWVRAQWQRVSAFFLSLAPFHDAPGWVEMVNILEMVMRWTQSTGFKASPRLTVGLC